LREVLPAQALLVEEEEMRPYDCDGLTAYRQLPLLVALPEDEAQAQAILKVCHELKVPVVARGAATGLSGGATPHPDGVLVSLAKLKKIIQRRPPVAHRGGPAGGAQPGGVRGGGALRALLRARPVVADRLHDRRQRRRERRRRALPEVWPDRAQRDARARPDHRGRDRRVRQRGARRAGYDLLALLNGSEGLLAMITEVTVRLTPKPELAQVVIASFDDVRKAGDAVASIIAAGIIPAGLEMMDKKAIHAVEPYVNAGYDMDAEAILLCESDGTPEEVAEEIGRMTAVLERSGAAGIRVSQDEAERLKFWAGRKAAFPAVGRMTPDYLCMDGTIPRKRLAEMLEAITLLSGKVRAALCQRLSRRRRQSASADHVRRQSAGRARAGDGFRCRDPGTVGALRRHHHRRAWGGYREGQC
jgi:glycolate oxidase